MTGHDLSTEREAVNDGRAVKAGQLTRRTAFSFVVLIGVLSLFSDMTYEGARSIYGPFLAVLGTGATAVGLIAGAGELVGYLVRLLSGIWADRTGKYWWFTIGGYALNLLVVPALALVGRWELAALLMIAERAGKGIRTPARDAMLSFATSRFGHGWGFALHEALDQTGAITGPLLCAWILATRQSYSIAFGVLIIPALIAMLTLVAARISYPSPRDLEVSKSAKIGADRKLPRPFWHYTLAVGLLAVGFADFPLIAFHIKRLSLTSDVTIPVLYSVAMGVDALSALFFGRLFDRYGNRSLVWAFSAAMLFAPLAFSSSLTLVVIGICLWGVGMGAMESIVKAGIAQLVRPERRATAFGTFNAVFGIAWFAGSAALGLLYDWHPAAAAAFAATMQGVAVLALTRVTTRLTKSAG